MRRFEGLQTYVHKVLVLLVFLVNLPHVFQRDTTARPIDKNNSREDRGFAPIGTYT